MKQTLYDSKMRLLFDARGEEGIVKDLHFLLQFCDIDTPKCLNLESAGL